MSEWVRVREREGEREDEKAGEREREMVTKRGGETEWARERER